MGKMTEEEARQDFLKRIENYKIQYEPLNDDIDDDLSYIKVCFYFWEKFSRLGFELKLLC